MKIELDLTPAQIDQLRQVIDWLPLARYATLICAVNKALPILESDAEATVTAADPTLGIFSGYGVNP